MEVRGTVLDTSAIFTYPGGTVDRHYWQALCDGDRHRSLAAVKRLRAGGADFDDIVEGHILPAQHRIGERWLAGELTVADEHRATAINEGLVQWLGSFTDPPGPDRPMAVVSCLEGEWHSLPALILAEHLIAQDHRVTYLGASPDPDDLVRQVLRLKPRAILLSASLTSSLARQKRLVGQLAALGIPVVLGGQGLGHDEGRALALGATAWCRSPADAVRLLEELPVRVPRVGPPAPTPADEEAAWVEEHRTVLVTHVLEGLVDISALPAGTPPITSGGWSVELEGLTDHLVGCLSSALATGDETILLEAHEWLSRVLTARGADPVVLVEAWSLLAEVLRGKALAREVVAATVGYADEAAAVAEAPAP